MTCTFFGHRNTRSADVREPLKELLVDLIENRNVTEFYVGCEGGFDRAVRSVLKELKNKYPHIRYNAVLAYLPRNNDEYSDYSDTIYPEGLEKVPPRFAISKRNEWMVNHSDMVITCIAHNFGGAAKYADYAKRKNKEVINLCDAYRFKSKV